MSVETGRGSGGTDRHEEEGGGATLSLEARLKRLDRIVAELESGEIELERGLTLFEEGVGHIREAEALLSRAELRVEELVGEASELETKPIEKPGSP